MDVRLTFLHDPDKDYMIRVCMTVEQALLHTPHSVMKQCEECDVDVWYDTHQVAPPTPPGFTIEREVILCLNCTAIHAMLDDEPMKWTPPE